MDKYNEYGFHMEDEFEAHPKRKELTAVPDITQNSGDKYYTERIVPKREKIGFKRFVIVAVICTLIGAPLMGIFIGAGQIFAENYFNVNEEQPVMEALVNNDDIVIAEPTKVNAVAGNSIVEVVNAAHPAVVNITTSVITQDQFFSYYFSQGSRERQGSGTGIIFRQDDENVYIMTNYHVIQEATSAYVSFDDNEQIEASPVGANKEEDIAVIKVSKEDLAEQGITDIVYADLGDSSELQVGEWVVAIGNAVGNGKTVTYGIISALNKEVSFDDGRTTINLIQTDAAINQGNSGGALVNMNGEVIGMNTAKLAGYTIEGMGFAIPINSIIDITEEIMDNRVTSRPFIGIAGETVTKEMAESRGLIVSEGVLLANVYEGGGASDAGLRPGDIIIEFNEQKIKTFEGLQEVVASTEIGSKVNVKIIRNNQRELETLITISDMAKVNPW